MYPYGKMAWNAVIAMSYLASIYEGPAAKASSASIARDREISKPLVAKVLTTLSKADLIGGSPGPGGGYYLARHPKDIFMIDIVRLFEKMDHVTRCPFGPNWCGVNDPCPIHDDIVGMNETAVQFLQNTSLEVFMDTQAKR